MFEVGIASRKLVGMNAKRYKQKIASLFYIYTVHCTVVVHKTIIGMVCVLYTVQ